MTSSPAQDHRRPVSGQFGPRARTHLASYDRAPAPEADDTVTNDAMLVEVEA